ncbi:hypothetical protein [Peribacillus kribbensis]|uniref:hypothetical protein n=1 Tax=Peribacillus kribbensis TaxID=356658 RepID=UPI00040BE69B|nr:hypothetical protein [Peribacillus kribbensis]
MRIYNKQELLRRHPDLISDVFDVWGAPIFIYLDVFMFSILLCLMLFASGTPYSITVGIPVAFFLLFICVYKVVFSGNEKPPA